MALNSINTNMGAMVALQALQSTQSQLAVTQKQISTGYRVADSTDDGAAYAIAQSIRSTVGALTSANQQLGSVTGLLKTTQSALNNISNMMASMRDVLVKMSDTSNTATENSNYATQYTTQLANVRSFIQDANYNGKSQIDDVYNSAGTLQGTASRISVARNETGATYGIAVISGSGLYGSISAALNTGAALAILGGSTIAGFITTTGTFMNVMGAVANDLSAIGSSINYINNQTTYNSNKIDALNGGLGSLIDADLAKESANLTALQIRQQLGTQALSLANQAPQSLLSLFK